MIDEELFRILACPVCKGDVSVGEHTVWCPQCKLGYPIRQGIPIMLVGEAEGGEKDEKNGAT
jgi:uncharacterized protein YbaR (Trm112 family)